MKKKRVIPFGGKWWHIGQNILGMITMITCPWGIYLGRYLVDSNYETAMHNFLHCDIFKCWHLVGWYSRFAKEIKLQENFTPCCYIYKLPLISKYKLIHQLNFAFPVPNPVTGLHISSCTSNSITLKWDSHQGPYTNVEITCLTCENTQVVTMTTEGTFRELSPNTEYEFSVVTISSDRRSMPVVIIEYTSKLIYLIVLLSIIKLEGAFCNF